MPLRDASGRLSELAVIVRDVIKRFEEMCALERKLADRAKASSRSNWNAAPTIGNDPVDRRGPAWPIVRSAQP
jgi:hypothetical protein